MTDTTLTTNTTYTSRQTIAAGDRLILSPTNNVTVTFDMTGRYFTVDQIALVSGTTYRYRTTAAHPFTTADTISVIGCTPTGYNVTRVPVTVSDNTHFDLNVGSNPAAASVFGTCAGAADLHVLGTFQSRPDATHTHIVTFTGIDETLVQGGGLFTSTVLPTAYDPGIWVTDAGVLDLVGQTKTPWVRAHADIASGQAHAIVNTTADGTTQGNPAGWAIGDKIAVTPTTAGDTTVERMTISSMSGGDITMTGNFANAHPRVAPGNGTTYGAELINETRNLRIQGTTSTSNTHIYIHNTSMVAQAFGPFELTNLGPRKVNTNVVPSPTTVKILGRWGLHFHHGMTMNQGSVITGVVGHDNNSHLFVLHDCDSITLSNCASVANVEIPFWWDGPVNVSGIESQTGTWENGSTNITYDHCISAGVSMSTALNGANVYSARGTLCGFVMGQSSLTPTTSNTGNALTSCVSAGAVGFHSGSGYWWPMGTGANAGAKTWGFTDCIAHNNNSFGIFFWTNDAAQDGQFVLHTFTRFVAYRNTSSGMNYGAYGGNGTFDHPVFYNNGDPGDFQFHALSGVAGGGPNGVPTVHTGGIYDGGGATHFSIENGQHITPGNTTKRFTFVDGTLRGWVTSPISENELINGNGQVSYVDFVRMIVDTGSGTRDLLITDFTASNMNVGSIIRVQRRNDQSAYQLTNIGTGTSPILLQTSIAPFADPAAPANPPTVSSFAPNHGAPGDSIVLTGTNFTGATVVSFNGTAASFGVDSDTQITANVPAGSTTGTVSVTTSAGTGTSAGSFTVDAPPPNQNPPTITSFSPTSGVEGDSVTIVGTNFTGTTIVRFNGIRASFVVTNDTHITATVRAGSSTGPISVQNAAGTATSATNFAITPPTPPPPGSGNWGLGTLDRGHSKRATLDR